MMLADVTITIISCTEANAISLIRTKNAKYVKLHMGLVARK